VGRIEKPTDSRRRGKRLARGPLPRALAAPHLPLLFGPDYAAGCRTCSTHRRRVRRLRHPRATMTSRFRRCRGAARELQAYKKRMAGVPMGVLVRRRFQPDFSVSFTEEQQRRGTPRIQLEGRPAMDETAAVPEIVPERGHGRDRRGHVHAREAGHARVRARGRHRLPPPTPPMRATDGLWGMYSGLDRAPRGRNETDVCGPPRRVRQTLSDVRCRGATAETGDLATHGSERASQQAFSASPRYSSGQRRG